MVKPHPLPGLAGRATGGVITAANEITRERLGARGNCPKDSENKEKRHHQAKNIVGPAAQPAALGRC